MQYWTLVRLHRGSTWAHQLTDPRTEKPTSLGNLVLGAASRSFAGFVLMPATVLKVRYEVQPVACFPV